MFVAFLSSASVEGAYCLLLYLHVQVWRGILFVAVMW